jgi:hypothetical protein
MRYESTFLFATPSLWEGVARLVDFAGTMDEYNTSRSEAEADWRALCADWLAVGRDLDAAMRAFVEHRGLEQQRLFDHDAASRAS